MPRFDPALSRLRLLLFVVAALGPSHLRAQTSQHAVTFGVEAVTQVIIVPTVAKTEVATAAVVQSGTWAITTNEVGAKVTASLSRPLPDGVSLSTQLTAPPGATSAGERPLGAAAATDLVTDLSKVSASGLLLTYRLDGAPAEGVAKATTVTFTITGGG